MTFRERIAHQLPATRHRDFRALWGGGACSSISIWTLLLANAWIVYKLSDSSFWVGVSTFASMSPYLLAPLGGTIADRIERRLLVRITRVAALVTTSILFLLAVTDVISVWMVVAMALAQGVIRAVELPADQALLANVVPPEHLANGVALVSTTQHGSRAAGPLLAGPLLATIGVEGAYAIAAVFALLSFTFVSQVRVSSRGGVVSVSHVFRNLGEGLSYIRGSRPVFAIFALVVGHCALTMSFDAMLPGFAETELHRPSAGFTIMTFGIGLGALIGTFTLSVMTGIRRGPLLLLTALASGIAPMLMALSMNIGSAAVSATLIGASQAMFMALASVLLQEVVPDALRGRVMSLFLMSAGGIMAFANLAFGSLADAWGTPVLFFIPGALFVAIVLASLVTAPNLRRVYRTGAMAVPAAPAG
ncbi:MAG: MFS transporter [Tepidiformaceae bacterium]